MSPRTFATNLKCGKCVAAVTPLFDGHPEVDSWNVDTSVPQKWLTVTGRAGDDTIRGLVAEAGFRILDANEVLDATQQAGKATSRWQTYRPLLLVAGYLLGSVVVVELVQGQFDIMRAMRHFMAGFFLVFSFFKMLDVSAFAGAFRSYDILARAVPAYAFAYPFIELGLGAAYLANLNPVATNVITLIVMTLGIVGVTQVLLAKKTIQCACLGTVFNLPMSYVTFIENGLMIVMAIGMLGLYLGAV